MKKEIFLVPYAHLDSQWRWEYPTTINKYIKNTIDENIYMFDKYPGHHFNFTGALRYQMMKEYYPEKFEKVKEYIADGKWHLAGTCLDETDALVPSVESSIRNILYGDRWQKEAFGQSSRDYMIPDCFGFPSNLPTVMNHCDIIGFSSQKLTWDCAVGIPFEIGMWRGPDGSEVISAFNPCNYNDHMPMPIYMNTGRKKRLNTLGEKNGIWKSFQYYGVGDIGGAPKEGSVKRALKSIKHYENSNGDIRVRQGAADQFFKEVTDNEKKKMDRYEGDLLLTKHSAGSITSAAIMKRWNRKNEMMASAAEAACVTAMIEAGASYPSDKIKSSWYRIIASQMHDILPGTSTPTAYEYSQNDEVLALNTWSTLLNDAAQAIAPHVEGKGEILLYNPIGDSRKDLVALCLPDWDESMGIVADVVDAHNTITPAQIILNEQDVYEALFIPTLRPFSWSRYSIKPRKTPVEKAVSITADDHAYFLENETFKVTVSFKGRIESIYNKPLAKELLRKPLAYEFQKEKPNMFPAWNMDWKDRIKPPFERIEKGSSVRIFEDGPLRCTLEIITKYNNSKFIKKISLCKSSKIVEFTEDISWNESGCSMKLALCANLDNPKATYNWQTARVNRGVNNSAAYEVPSRLWADVSTEDFGISIIEDSKYGYDRPSADTLRMTMLYTPSVQSFNGFHDQQWQDWGSHTIRYAFFAHDGSLSETDVLAGKFNQSIRSFIVNDATKTADKRQITLLEPSTEQISILAVKKPEDCDGVLVRVCERYDKDVDGEISFGRPIETAVEVNGLEETIGKAEVDGHTLLVKIPASGISSYIVKFAGIATTKEFKQETISLNYNTSLIGSNGDKEGKEKLFPAEITPEIIESGFVRFNLATERDNNALMCTGQEIPLPMDYNTLSILVSSKEDDTAKFTWVDHDVNEMKTESLFVPSMTGFVGQWDTRIWKKDPKHEEKGKRDYFWFNKCTGITPGHIYRNRLEWYSTHTHTLGVDQAYKFGYMYTLELTIPKGAKKLKLPENASLYILAMTASDSDVKVQSTQHYVDKYDF